MTLKRFMKENKIGTKILAEATGINADYLNAIRGGSRRASPEKAKLIVDGIAALELAGKIAKSNGGITVLNLLYPQDAERQETGSKSTVEVSI